MTVYDRFNTILAKVDVTLACSLPVFNNGREILFFYSTESNRTDNYTITGVKRAFSRRNDTGIIDELDVNSISVENISNCVGLTVFPRVFDSDAETVEESYLTIYERIYQSLFSSIPLESDLCQKFLASFELLVPSSELQALYYELGKDLFEAVRIA